MKLPVTAETSKVAPLATDSEGEASEPALASARVPKGMVVSSV
jgi:hypothetical protein